MAGTLYGIGLGPGDPELITVKGLRLLREAAVVFVPVRRPGGQCLGLFYPDLATPPVQARHLDYHWDGTRVDFYREPATGAVFAVQ